MREPDEVVLSVFIGVPLVVELVAELSLGYVPVDVPVVRSLPLSTGPALESMVLLSVPCMLELEFELVLVLVELFAYVDGTKASKLRAQTAFPKFLIIGPPGIE
jgi:hypothetical protein